MGKNDWVGVVAPLGFPIVVAFYFMFRMERVLDRMVEVLTAIQVVLAGIE